MRDWIESGTAIAIILLLGVFLGWCVATVFWMENTVSDCKHLGKFRYSDKVYVCSAQGEEVR
jgi:uncharacterized membrane protein YciS (DUF1049 family)